MKKYICIDIGGTAVKYGVIDENENFLIKKETPTKAGERKGPGIMECIKKLTGECLEEFPEAEGIAVSTAGMVDPEKGEIFYSSPLIPEWTGTKIKDILEEEFHIPCEVENISVISIVVVGELDLINSLTGKLWNYDYLCYFQTLFSFR